jgi:hypothetical protein
MGHITKQRLALLDEQIKGAAVTALEDGYYQVFVPGAVREDNKVTAKSKKEALAKVHELLKVKTNEYPETSTGHVVIQPRSLK